MASASSAGNRPGRIRAPQAGRGHRGRWRGSRGLGGGRVAGWRPARGPGQRQALAQQVGPAAVIAVSLLAGFAAWALLALLERHDRHPRRNWTAVAATVLVISLAGPLTAGRGIAAVTALCCLRLAVGAVLIPAMRRTARGWEPPAKKLPHQ